MPDVSASRHELPPSVLVKRVTREEEEGVLFILKGKINSLSRSVAQANPLDWRRPPPHEGREGEEAGASNNKPLLVIILQVTPSHIV